jgi:hypothetical protein
MESNKHGATRQEREANALRENLAKRKQQARHRSDAERDRPEQPHPSTPAMPQGYEDLPCQ